MIQGGGLNKQLSEKITHASIRNEADNGLRNDRGTIAMARTGDPHSATSQFFINLVDNGFLNHRSKNGSGWGYAVFGKVIEGMDIVDAIAAVKPISRGPYKDVPAEPIIINKVTIVQ